MKILTSALSPFARKASILIRKKGLIDRVQEVAAVLDGANGYTDGANPLGKIPALIRDGQETLFDSSVICEYLDSLSDPWLPASGEERFKQLRLHALGDGMSEAVYNYRYETVRPDELHWPQIIERHETAMRNALNALEADIDALGGPWSFGNVSVVCALAYMDYRAPKIKWRTHAPKLAEWIKPFESDPAFQDTNAYN